MLARQFRHPQRQAFTLMLKSAALVCAAEPPTMANANRVNIFFMYQASFSFRSKRLQFGLIFPRKDGQGEAAFSSISIGLM